MRIFIITICLALVALAANAQTITDDLRRDKSGQGKVVINQSAEIESLVNNAAAQQTTTTVTTNSQADKQKTQTANADAKTQVSGVMQPVVSSEASRANVNVPEKKEAAPERKSVAAGAADPSSSEAPAVNTNKKIMRHSYKTTGYRIQVYSGGNKRSDREKCEQISARLKAAYPDLPVYVHFYSPSWKCRAGNYTDMNEAKQMLRQIRAMGYNQACLVKGTINVQY